VNQFANLTSCVRMNILHARRLGSDRIYNNCMHSNGTRPTIAEQRFSFTVYRRLTIIIIIICARRRLGESPSKICICRKRCIRYNGNAHRRRRVNTCTYVHYRRVWFTSIHSVRFLFSPTLELRGFFRTARCHHNHHRRRRDL
jgi:hypothetical protein